MSVRVKVCGITRPEDARLAVVLGAAAIGFNFWRLSPRYVEPARALRIGALLPPQITRIGVFVDADLPQILRIARDASLSAVQLHGEEPPSLARSLPLPVVRAFRRRGSEHAPELLRYPCAAVLLDAHVPGAHGGTGQRSDWRLAVRVARLRRLVLAGGLNPENLVEALVAVKPYGVDLNSGVEQAPGKKDPDLLRQAFTVLSQSAGAVGPGAAPTAAFV
jgi:phosphoribosylanthranilate isomerase